MQRILTGLTVLNLLLLAAAFWLGLHAEPREAVAATVEASRIQALNAAFHRHFLVGLLAGIATLLVHSIVMTYFIGTGRWVKEAVARWRLDPALERATRKLKARCFPFAFFSMVLIIVTTILGAACDNGSVPSWVHLSAALVAVGFNLVSYFFEYAAVERNVALLQQVVRAASAQQQHG